MDKSAEERIDDFVNLVEAMKGTVRQLHKPIQVNASFFAFSACNFGSSCRRTGFIEARSSATSAGGAQ
jgi:hypothetical protein